MSEPPTRTDPTPGGDDVQAMHRPHMDLMNDPVMLSADGTPSGIPDIPGQDSVARMHDVLMREQAEPHDGFEPVPVWVYAVFAGLLFWGGMYVGANTADFRRDVFDRSDLSGLTPPGGPRGPEVPDPDPRTVAELVKVGAAKYQSVCQSCHQPHGNGDPAQGVPPLNGSEWVVGAEASAARLARIVLYGLHQPITVKGRTYNGQMPAQGVAMRDYEIAGVITYIRNAWDNKGDPDDSRPAVTASVVRAAREKEGNRRANGTAPVTEAELKKLPVDYTDTAPPPAKKDEKKDDKK
jgi:mono/diheme cytochrome c family protein